MAQHTDLIASLFGKSSLGEVDEQALEGFLQAHPYFAQARWWLAAKRQQNKGDLSLALSGLFAYHPLRLQQFIKSQAQEPKNPILQPLYTEDYFAYTRTKLPEKLEIDKRPTMEQLQSFTGWLRTMKRPGGGSSRDPETPMSETEEENENPENEPFTDVPIQLEEDIHTEAMAEIRLKHGQNEKAIEIYEKLILLNPEKRSYFAKKIAALKKQ